MQLKQYLESLSAELGARLGSVDASCVSGSDAASVVSLLASLKAQISAAELSFGARAVEANVHLAAGARDGAAWLSDVSGVSVGEARASLATASQLESLPEVRDAVVSGSLSVEKAKHIAEAGVVNPSAVAGLLDSASKVSFSQLKKTCREVGLRSGADELERYQALRKHRAIKTWTNSLGMFRADITLMVDEGATLMGRLGPFVDAAFRDAYRAGRHGSHESYVADGFMAMIETSGGPRRADNVEVRVSVDYEALERGYAKDGEHCELIGIGPVPVALVKSLSQDAYLSQVVKKKGKPAIVEGKGAYIPRKLEIAVWAKDKDTCSVPKCGSQFRLQMDHIIPRSKQGPSKLENLQLLCLPHHRQKTARDFGWMKKAKRKPAGAPEEGTGARAESGVTEVTSARAESVHERLHEPVQERLHESVQEPLLRDTG